MRHSRPAQAHVPTYTRARLRTVFAMTREAVADPYWKTLSREAQIAYVVGGLICDETGTMSQAALESALADPECVDKATFILEWACR